MRKTTLTAPLILFLPGRKAKAAASLERPLPGERS